MDPRFIKREIRTPAQQGAVSDDEFFTNHRRRQLRIREPVAPQHEEGLPEFDAEFSTLGEHDASRRRIIVKRVEPLKVMQFGVKYMPIPFLLFGEESIEDDDATLKPIFDDIMRGAAASYAR